MSFPIRTMEKIQRTQNIITLVFKENFPNIFELILFLFLKAIYFFIISFPLSEFKNCQVDFGTIFSITSILPIRKSFLILEALIYSPLYFSLSISTTSYKYTLQICRCLFLHKPVIFHLLFL